MITKLPSNFILPQEVIFVASENFILESWGLEGVCPNLKIKCENPNQVVPNFQYIDKRIRLTQNRGL